MSDFKVGDKVKVVAGLHEGNNYGVYCNKEMVEMCGVILTITSVDSRTGSYRVKGNRWNWSPDMIEVVPRFEVGDKIQVIEGINEGLKKAVEEVVEEPINNLVRIRTYSMETLELLDLVERLNREDNEIFFWNFINEFVLTKPGCKLEATYMVNGSYVYSVTMQPSNVKR